MDIPPIKKCSLKVPLPSVFIPNELIAEILSFLSVKTITQFRCVNKLWNTLISDPNFVKMHFKKSSQNPHFILPILEFPLNTSSVISLPVCHLLENLPISAACEIYHNLNDNHCQVVGSCNGLLCLIFECFPFTKSEYWFCLWNPATGTISEGLGFFPDYKPLYGPFRFTFGFDYLSEIYKVVAFRQEGKEVKNNVGLWRNEVRLFSLGDNSWRNIESFPIVSHICNDGMHFRGTVNWLAICDDFESISVEGILQAYIPHVEIFVIISLDLSTETYTQFLLPKGFNELPCVMPSLQVLMDYFCFSHDFKGTEFVIWKMKEFGLQESWTQLLRIDYFNLPIHILPIYDDLDLHEYMRCETPLSPFYLSKNGDTLILISDEDDKVISIYNHTDKRVKRTRISNDISWFSAFHYAESLVSTPWKSQDVKEEDEEDEQEHEGYLLPEVEEQQSDIDLGIDGLDED